MKKTRQTFNFLLQRYHYYVRKLKNLKFANRNERRQLIIEKRIEKLFNQLKGLHVSISKKTVALSLVAGAALLTGTSVNAQNFGAAQTNPFGLVSVPGGYSNVTMADLDGDGDFDLLSGDYYGNLVYYSNNGTNVAPAFGAPQTNPFNLTNVGTLYSAPTFVDIDSDGDFDIMAHDYTNGAFVFYENTGTSIAPDFATSQTNPFSLLSMGFATLSSPTFADLDNDGDLDMLSCVDYTSSFLYYENTGTASAPVFGAAVLNPFGIAQVTGYDWANPCFVDVDNDGDFDIILGDNSGNFGFLKNIGDATTPNFDTEVTNPFNLSNLGDYNNACFVDLDNDGDKDLMGGDGNGNISYFEMLNLPPVPPTDLTPNGNLNICYATSTQLTVTGVGTIGWYDAANGGTYLGGGSVYTTPILNTTTTFYAQDSTIGGASANRTAITVNVAAAIDINTSVNGLTISATATGATYQWLDCNNSDAIIPSETNQDYIAIANGSYSVEITVAGCVDTSACVPITTVGINENSLANDFNIYPNPTTGVFTIEAKEIIGLAEVKVMTLDGKLIYTTTLSSDNRLNIDGSTWSKGIYLIQIKDDFISRNRKLIIE